MLTGMCRGTDKLGKWFASAKEGRKSSTDGSCANASDSQCRSTDTLVALGNNKWTSTDSAVCVALDNAKCRTDKKTEVAISGNAT